MLTGNGLGILTGKGLPRGTLTGNCATHGELLRGLGSSTGNCYGGFVSPTGSCYGDLAHPRGIVTGICLGDLVLVSALFHGDFLRKNRHPRGTSTGKAGFHGGFLRGKPASTGYFYGEARFPRGISTGKPVFHGDFYGGFLRGNPFSTGDFYGETPFSTGDFYGENRFLQRISTHACKATGKNDSKATSAKEGALWCKRGGGVVGWMPTGLCTGVRCCALAFAFDSLMMLGIARVMSLLVFCLQPLPSLVFGLTEVCRPVAYACRALARGFGGGNFAFLRASQKTPAFWGVVKRTAWLPGQGAGAKYFPSSLGQCVRTPPKLLTLPSVI